MSRRISRRELLRYVGLGGSAALLAACQPKVVEKIVKETVLQEKIVKEVVKETVMVAGTPKVVEREVTRVVAATPAPEKEIVDITVAFSDGSEENSAVRRLALMDATRTRINFQTVGSADWATKMNMLLATGQVPDIMEVDNAGSIQDYASPSVLHPIMPLAEKYGPNLKRYLDEQMDESRGIVSQLRRWAVAGVHYIVPKLYINQRRYAPMPVIRMDWLEEVGLASPPPDDFDQFYEAMKELKKAHPDSYWTTRGGIRRNLVLWAYPMGSGLGGWFRGQDAPYFDKAVDGGKWVYGPIHPEFKDVLAYFSRAYEEGILHPDVASMTKEQWQEMNSADKGLAGYDNFVFVRGWLEALRETNPDAKWTILPTLKGKRGRRQNDFRCYEGGYVVGAGSKHPDRVTELLDWMCTPEGIDTNNNWGVEGIHYDLKCPRPATIEDYTLRGISEAMDPKCLVIKPEIVEMYREGGGILQPTIGTGVGGELLIFSDGTVLTYWDPPGEEAASWFEITDNDLGLHSEVLVPPFTKEEIEKVKDPKARVDAIMVPAMEKVVLGLMTLSEYDQAVQDAIKAGAQDMEAIYNEAEARMK